MIRIGGAPFVSCLERRVALSLARESAAAQRSAKHEVSGADGDARGASV